MEVKFVADEIIVMTQSVVEKSQEFLDASSVQ